MRIFSPSEFLSGGGGLLFFLKFAMAQWLWLGVFIKEASKTVIRGQGWE